MNKPTMSGASKRREETWSGSREYIHRANGKSQHITTQAPSTCIHYAACTTNPICHYMTAFRNHDTQLPYGLSLTPTREIPSSSVSLAGHHQNSNWGREPAFNPPVQSSHESQMLAMLDRQQQTSAQSSKFYTAAA